MQTLSEISKNFNVLYVEDDIQTREIASKTFQRFFNRLSICKNGQEGLLKFIEHQKEDPFDIVISDIDMPIMNGIEMLKKIKELDKNVITFILSAKTDSNYLLDAIELNINHFLTKPIDLSIFMAKMEDICKLKCQKNS